jgi:hypothetical protein
MKFNTVISNPPFRAKQSGWIDHVRKHLYLLDNDDYYVLVCPASEEHHLTKAICDRFDVVKIEKVGHFDGLKNLDADVYYYIWKK